jgi:hypothetical protein
MYFLMLTSQHYQPAKTAVTPDKNFKKPVFFLRVGGGCRMRELTRSGRKGSISISYPLNLLNLNLASVSDYAYTTLYEE